MRTLISAAALVLISCGHEESQEIIVVQPKPTAPVVVYVPVPVPAETPRHPDNKPTQMVTVCQVLLTDKYGNISRLTKHDVFTRDIYFAAEFTPEQATEYVRLKHGKVTGSVSKMCYEKEQDK